MCMDLFADFVTLIPSNVKVQYRGAHESQSLRPLKPMSLQFGGADPSTFNSLYLGERVTLTEPTPFLAHPSVYLWMENLICGLDAFTWTVGMEYVDAKVLLTDGLELLSAVCTFIKNFAGTSLGFSTSIENPTLSEMTPMERNRITEKKCEVIAKIFYFINVLLYKDPASVRTIFDTLRQENVFSAKFVELLSRSVLCPDTLDFNTDSMSVKIHLPQRTKALLSSLLPLLGPSELSSYVACFAEICRKEANMLPHQIVLTDTDFTKALWFILGFEELYDLNILFPVLGESEVGIANEEGAVSEAVGMRLIAASASGSESRCHTVKNSALGHAHKVL